ncbi:uncharacterized protein BDZ99DRAFT_165779 [Mytilinidion resinicola]|uniref:Uncharacterized protein n=1 Tax=Mytilinidion resinicola TaxID=574789 RepID=A0A6A6Y3U0_9PEZI|nr:uncharacterized protein BDZ99DRAFT_165779 [Mytilinidion resinicola]KAF2803501.1 hypothetical protein BDZ99DRAFT_165779 [Mytilinidion resinicola]
MPTMSWLLSIRQKKNNPKEPESQRRVTKVSRFKAVENETIPRFRRSLTLPLNSPSPIYYSDQPPLRRRIQRTLNQDACLLFRLPLELRTIIYGYVLADGPCNPLAMPPQAVYISRQRTSRVLDVPCHLPAGAHALLYPPKHVGTASNSII